MNNNIILNTDSYKASHYKQYPPGTQYVSSYIEARGHSDNLLRMWNTQIINFGLQIFLKQYLSKPITMHDVHAAKQVFEAHGEPFNLAGWVYIVETLKGKLPIKISAVPEGKPYPVGTPVLEIRNTDHNVPWLTSYLETALIRAVWYPSTVATISRHCKQIIKDYLEKTADNLDNLPFKLHDFGARGVSSNESAAVGGCAHLVNFMGTDTVAGLTCAIMNYNCTMPGFSIPAAEHSTITAWGRENEAAAYKNMLDQFSGPNKLVAVVSDSYNIYNACEKIWGEELRSRVIQNGGTIVIRPDSGDPFIVVPKVLDILGNKFGFSTNTKGYKILPPYLRVIQGDGINFRSMQDILEEMEMNDWSADNIAFGMGGGLLQHCNRDTFKFAMKASAIYKDAQWHGVSKSPVTDSGKKSKEGVQTHPDFQVVYENGEIKKEWTFDQVRANAALTD